MTLPLALVLLACPKATSPADQAAAGGLIQALGPCLWEVSFPDAHLEEKDERLVVYDTSDRAVAFVTVVSADAERRDRADVYTLCASAPLQPGFRVGRIHAGRLPFIRQCVARVTEDAGVPVVVERGGRTLLELDQGLAQGLAQGDQYTILGPSGSDVGPVSREQPLERAGTCTVRQLSHDRPNQAWCEVELLGSAGLPAEIHLILQQGCPG